MKRRRNNRNCTCNRPRRIYYSDQNLREKMTRRWQEIRLLTGDIRKPIYRDIVGDVFSSRLDIDGETAIEVVVKVTENGPEIVANQLWHYDGSDEGVSRNRNTIGSDLEWELAKIRSRNVMETAKPRPEFVARTDGKVHPFRVTTDNGYAVNLTVELTRYKALIRRDNVRPLFSYE